MNNLYLRQLSDNIIYFIVGTIITVLLTSIFMITNIFITGFMFETTSLPYETGIYRIEEVIPMAGPLIMLVNMIFCFGLGSRAMTIQNGYQKENILLGLPISRLGITLSRILSSFTLLGGYFFIVFLNLFILLEIYSNQLGYSFSALVSVSVTLFFTGLVMFSLGLILSLFIKRYIVNIIGLSYIVIMLLVNILSLTRNPVLLILNAINPFRYIIFQVIISTEKINSLVILGFGLISLVMVFIGLIVYNKKDF
jgi:hypothetical protein